MSTARKTAATRRKPLDAANDAGTESTGTEYLESLLGYNAHRAAITLVGHSLGALMAASATAAQPAREAIAIDCARDGIDLLVGAALQVAATARTLAAPATPESPANAAACLKKLGKREEAVRETQAVLAELLRFDEGAGI